MSNVLAQAIEWIKSRPFWEQRAFQGIIEGKEFTDDTYDQLIRFCLEDAGIEDKNPGRPEILWSGIDTTLTSAECVKIIQLNNLQNVNVLAKDQTLTFHPNLTVIYGANGSGKSGYSRMLAFAGFSRGDATIRPDIMKSADEPNDISFDLIYSAGDAQHGYTFTIPEQTKKLHSVYVFDSLSVVSHLTKPDKISFSPAGLIYFSKLGKVVTNCIQRLEAKTQKFQEPHGFENLFPGQSEVRRAVAGNEFTKLKTLSKINNDHSARIEELATEISRLRLESVADQVARLKQIISDMNVLTRHLQRVETALTSEMEEINREINLFNALRSKTETDGVGQFKSSGLVNIGSPEWSNFIKAARKFAGAQSAAYPNEKDECLLCHQTLSPEAHAMLHSLWAFLEADLQTKVNEAQNGIENKIKKIESLKLDFFNEQSVTYRYLEANDPDLVSEIAAYINGCTEFIDGSLDHIRKFEIVSPGFGSKPPIEPLEKLIISLRSQIETLERKDPTEEIYLLESELRELQHRTTLKDNWERISDYFKNIEWAKKAKRALGNTRHITQKHNELFQLLVTTRYVELFKETLRELNCPLNVNVSTKGRHAEVLKQILLESPTSSAKPENILSEGEKRAVAIADFITEATLDEDCSVIVLDDPVTSLDHEWKETMAKRLVTESVKRQVIIFTHDRPFLSLLKRFAEEKEIELASHSIERKFDDSPGYIHLNYSPDLVDDYKTVGKATELLIRARNAKTPDERKFLLQQGFNALRTTYEAFIMLKLFAGVVRRFDPHIKVNNLKQIFFDQSILDKVIEKFNYISRFTGGHLPSDQLELEPVTPESLDSEIKEFTELEKELKELKRQAKNN